jgi:putative Holliday junction resolvase
MRILGLDLGTKTCGVAMSDALQFLASPVTTLRFSEGDYSDALSQVVRLAQEHDIQTICLGYPKHMNNTLGDGATRSSAFEAMLNAAGYDVVLIDERLSTKQALGSMIASKTSKKKRKTDIDQGAAVVILQTYLDQRRST